MDFPTVNWMIANLIGVVIYIVIWYLYDLLFRANLPIKYYFFLFMIFIIITILDFYIYHKNSLKEENKSIWDQLRDMAGSFGITMFILLLCGLITLYYNIKYAHDLHLMYKIRNTKEFNTLATKVGNKIRKKNDFNYPDPWFLYLM